jgi:hypothetical protein
MKNSGSNNFQAAIDDIASTDADVRAAAMDTLAGIAAGEAAPFFRQGLRDTDERVRSHAARGLVRIGHAEALPACLSTIDDNPDELHLDLTPSVHALGEMGIEAMAPLLELMSSGERDRRMHAQRAFEMIVARRFGFRPGQGFPDVDAEKAARRIWTENGSYDFAANVRGRKASIVLWRRWLTKVRSDRA